MKIARLLLRLLIGALFVGHGTQKLFGWFGGHGLEGTSHLFEQIGYSPGRPMAYLGGADRSRRRRAADHGVPDAPRMRRDRRHDGGDATRSPSEGTVEHERRL